MSEYSGQRLDREYGNTTHLSRQNTLVNVYL